MILNSKKQICEEFGIGNSVFKKWRKRGLPVFFDGRSWVGYKDDIEEFMREYISSKNTVKSKKHTKNVQNTH